MVNTLYGLTPNDDEWRTALTVAILCHGYKPATHPWERLMQRTEQRIEKPSARFLQGLNAEGVHVYRNMQNVKAIEEWVEQHSTTWEPPAEQIWFSIYLAELPDPITTIMPSGPLVLRDELTQADL